MRSTIALIALTLAGFSTVGCVRETVSCADNPSSVCPEDTGSAEDTGPRADANVDAPGLDAFEPSMPDSGADAFIPPDATLCSPACSGETPVCVSAGVCGECATASDCVGNPDGAVCDPASHECVRCTAADNTCAGTSTPVCDTEMNRCVTCLEGQADACTNATQPACDVSGASPSCSCTSMSCTSATAARCDEATNACVPCMGNTDCNHVSGSPYCIDGVCRPCTVATEATDCMSTGGSCNPTTNVCGTRPRGSVTPCNRCDADSECGAGLTCAQPTNRVGSNYYCLPRRSGACARPFVNGATVTTATGVVGTSICEHRLATCEAFLAHGSQPVGCSDSASTDLACGAPSTDGLCRENTGGNNFCTLPCVFGTSNDCPAGAICGSLLPNPLSPAYCSI